MVAFAPAGRAGGGEAYEEWAGGLDCGPRHRAHLNMRAVCARVRRLKEVEKSVAADRAAKRIAGSQEEGSQPVR